MSTAALLAQSLKEYMSRTTDERLARERYEGGSWGYHGHEFIEATYRAEQTLEADLTAFIDARIAAALAKLQT